MYQKLKDKRKTSKHKCPVCVSEFVHKRNLYAHIRKFHKSIPVITRPNQNIKCDVCGQKFSYRSCLVRHILRLHSAIDHDYVSTGPVRKLRVICPHNTCNEAFFSYPDLRIHLFLHHDVEVDYEDFTFDSISDFEEWKKKIQKETQSLYSQDSSMKLLKSGGKRIFFNCHRSYQYKCKSKTQRVMRLSTNKIGKVCPSRIEMMLTEDNNVSSVSVRFWKTHYGHYNEQCRKVALKRNKRLKITEKNKTTSGIRDKEHIVSNDDTDSELEKDTSPSVPQRDCKDTYNIKPNDNDTTKHQNDAISVAQWMEEMMELDEDAFIIYYKEQSLDSKQDMIFLELEKKNGLS